MVSYLLKGNKGKCSFKSMMIQLFKTMDSKHRRRPHREGVRQLKYNTITLQQRMELVELVQEQRLSIYEASKMVGINNATAKDIIKKYRKEGKVFIRKAELLQLQKEERNFDVQNIPNEGNSQMKINQQEMDIPALNAQPNQEQLSLPVVYPNFYPPTTFYMFYLIP